MTKKASVGPKIEIRPPSFDSEGDLSLFLRQFNNAAKASGWTKTQKKGYTQAASCQETPRVAGTTIAAKIL